MPPPRATRLPSRSPDLASLVLPLLAEPWPFFDALAREPRAFLHGDAGGELS